MTNLEEFDKARLAFDELTNDDKLWAVTHWACILECENLKSMGLVAGSIEADLDGVRMLYGYAVGKGYTADLSKQSIKDHMTLLAANN